MNICGECTACCTLSVVKDLDKGAGVTCKHCVLTQGCSIYADRPKVCKEFECAYLQGGSNIKLRPDKCGIMFVKVNERIFTGIFVPGVEVTDIARGQVNAFRQQGYSVILVKQGEKPHIEVGLGRDKHEVYNEYLELLKNGNI